MFTTGLEGSAEGGEGPGIEAFRPQRGPLQISSNLRIPNLAKLMRGVGENAEDFVVPIAPAERGTQWRLWTREEMGEAENAGMLSHSFWHICGFPGGKISFGRPDGT